jgi:molybdate transport system regulatory protein
LVMAEVKAPWLTLFKGDEKPRSAAENIFHGTLHRIIRGRVTSEVIVRLPDGTELCSVITEESAKRLDLKITHPLWVVFNAFAVVLHID